jgi:hypothetical protein
VKLFWIELLRGRGTRSEKVAAPTHGLPLARPPASRWLLNDLLSVDRLETPWIVAVFHAPWYVTTVSHFQENECHRQITEPLFQRFGVDLVFNGESWPRAFQPSSPQLLHTQHTWPACLRRTTQMQHTTRTPHSVPCTPASLLLHPHPHTQATLTSTSAPTRSATTRSMAAARHTSSWVRFLGRAHP